MPKPANRLYVPEFVHVARTLLIELRAAHRRLIAELASMDRITARKAADPTSCTTARWQLSQAALQRRLIAARICDYFTHRLDADRRDELKRLASADQALLRESSALLGRWPTSNLEQDWIGFCHASREIRRREHAHIVLEQQLLYPLLQDAVKIAA